MENKRSIFVEVGSIVLGVLLALGASEWNDNRIERERADIALQNIAAELQSNLEILKAIHSNNVGIITAIRKPPESSTEPEGQFVPGLQIQQSAWDTMVAMGINDQIEYDTLRAISATYSFQNIYRSISFQMIENIMSVTSLAAAMNPERGKDLPDDLFIENFELVVLTETGLLTQYKKTIEKLAELGYESTSP